MTAKEHFERINPPKAFTNLFPALERVVTVHDIQAILDDGRRAGMLEAAEIARIARLDHGDMSGIVTERLIREHAAKLFPKATND